MTPNEWQGIGQAFGSSRELSSGQGCPGALKGGLCWTKGARRTGRVGLGGPMPG